MGFVLNQGIELLVISYGLGFGVEA